MTAPTSFKDTATNFDVSMAGVAQGYTTAVGALFCQLVSVTNAFGVTIDYRVFRTLNILNGAINIIVA
jgi:hypothetical protein